MMLTMILAIISLVIGIMVLAGMWGQHVSPPPKPPDLRELPSDGVYDYCPVCGERLQNTTQAVMSHVIKCVLTYVDQKT